MSGFLMPSFPASNSQQRQSSSGRSKVALKPGRSLMDWIKLGKSGRDLQGFSGRIRAVTLDELVIHNTVDDCWMAIRGHVYNVTHYMEYHPGGVDELMKGAGKDATALFEAVHKWVNFSSMLAKCYIGPLKYETKIKELMKKPPDLKKENKFLAPIGIPSLLKDYLPRYEWYEKNVLLVLTIYIKNTFHPNDIIADCNNGKMLDVKVLFSEKFYRIHLEMEHLIKELIVMSVTDKKIEITLEKENYALKWTKFGSPLDGHNLLKSNNERELKYHTCQVISIEQVTYNTKLYTMELPKICHFITPIGHHTKIKADIAGMEVQRSYTTVLPSLDSRKKRDSKKGKLLYFMIKHYDNGTLTPYLNSLEINSSIDVSDAIGSFNRTMLKERTKIYLIAAGTGFTPMIRLINYYLHDAVVSSKVKLLFANKRYNDILWKDQIDDIVRKYPCKFNCTYILSDPDSTWTGLTGRINQDILQKFIDEDPFLKENETDVPASVHITVSIGELFAICGPDEFTLSVKMMLLDCGIEESNIHAFLG